LSRGYKPDQDERLIRELVLQLKLGRVRPAYFSRKYGVDILQRFEEPLGALDQGGYLSEVSHESVALTRAGLLRIDSLLPRFFQPRHAGIRYT
jgi:oxygen-independent coproporphyrinogen-3 oxidase